MRRVLCWGQARRAARELTGLVADADAAPGAVTSAHETLDKLAPQTVEKEKGDARREIGKVEAKEGSCAEDVVFWLSFVVTAGVLVVAGTRQRRRQG